MGNWKFLTAVLAVVVILVVSSVFFFTKKGSEPPKPPQNKVEAPLPKPAEPPKKDVSEIKEEPKTKNNEKKIIKEDEKQVVREKRELPRKLKSPVTTPSPNEKAAKLPLIVDFVKLNNQFNSYGLNVWASPLKDNEILLNGYVKNEKERRAALSIARRYRVNITDMINVVEVYDIEESNSSRVHQPLPFSK